MAYTLVDVDSAVPAEAIEAHLRGIDGVLAVRYLPLGPRMAERRHRRGCARQIDAPRRASSCALLRRRARTARSDRRA